jgi:hypothetical protein
MLKVKKRSNIPKFTLEQHYEAALNGLARGVFSSLQQAAEAYGLPKSSLGHRKNGRQTREIAHQEHQTFTPAAEKAIVKWILKLDDFQFWPRIDNPIGMVKHLQKLDFQRQVPVPNFAQQNLIGKNWITCFLNRHPILAARFASRIDHQRAHASNPQTSRTYFQKRGKIMRAQQLSDKAITHVDERGFVMGISPRTMVVTRWGKKHPRIKQDGKREFIPALEAVSADGFVFPPYLIGKGSVHIFDWYKNVGEADHNARWAVLPKVSTDSKIGYNWLTNVYDPMCKARCPGESRLLFLDGHVSLINYKFLTFREANNIVVFACPLIQHIYYNHWIFDFLLLCS